MNRELRLAAVTNGNLLRANRRHMFAARHALRLFHTRAIYSYIPKNGCTSLRYSLAIANKCLSPGDDPRWVDDNNATFVASLSDAVLADYTFVVLRCPFRRLASAYLEKLTRDTPWRQKFLAATSVEAGNLSFRRFVDLLERPAWKRFDHHWAAQVDFLLYKEYDAVFRLEDFDAMAGILVERIGLRIHDTRALVKHGLDQFALVEGDFGDTPADEIGTLRETGRSPSHAALYDPALIAATEALYAKDFGFYRRRFGATATLFAPAAAPRPAS